GLVLGETIGSLMLMIVAGFLGVLAAAIARNFVFVHLTKLWPHASDIPSVIIVFSVVASLAGSMTAQEITRDLVHLSPTLACGLAGLISAVLMVMLMAAYKMKPAAYEN